jgi:hypothetical protein
VVPGCHDVTCGPRECGFVRVEALLKEALQHDVVVTTGSNVKATLAEAVPRHDVKPRPQKNVDDLVEFPNAFIWKIAVFCCQQ